MTTWKKPILLAWAVLAATSPATSPAGGWGSGARGDDCAPGTRQARAEWRPPFRRSQELEWLDCAGLACYGESTRQSMNARYLAIYQRPTLKTLPPQAPAATFDSLVPLLEPPGSTTPAR